MNSSWSGGRKTTIIGLACTTADDACFCTAVGLSPADTKGSDLFLTPLEGGGYACETCSDKGEELIARHTGTVCRTDQSKNAPTGRTRKRRT